MPSPSSSIQVLSPMLTGFSTGTFSVSGLDSTGSLSGVTPVAIAVLRTSPAAASAAVMVYGPPSQVTDLPGASVVSGQVTGLILSSVTSISDISTSPVLVTT